MTRPGGVQEFVTHLYEQLKGRGHEVRIITQRPSNFKGDPPKDYVLFGVTKTFKKNGLGTEGDWGMPSDGDEIAAYFNKENFDVINFHEPWVPWLAWQIQRNSKSVYVATFHANLVDTAASKIWTSKVWTPLGRPFLESMHAFTATAPVATGGLFRMADMNRPFDRYMVENIRYIPLGVDLKKFKPAKKRIPLNGVGTKTIVYLGRVEKRKGSDLLLKAFAELVKQMPTTHLVIAGDGPMSPKLKSYVEAESVPNVHSTGYVSEEEKIHLLANADLACFPSPYGEGYGIVILEAMATGTPILAGNNIGYAQAMKGRGRIGLVDPGATKDFTNRLAVMLEDEELRNIMTSWELREVKQYDYPRVVAQYEQAYKDAIKDKDKIEQIAKKNSSRKYKQAISRLSVRRHAGQ